MSEQSMYPDFNVMNQQPHWDGHTSEIVNRRLAPVTFTHLTDDEVQTFYHLSATLLADKREEILRYVVSHLDNKVGSTIGQGQRKKGMPEQKLMIQGGAGALNHLCRAMHSGGFAELSNEVQNQVVDQLFNGQIQLHIAGEDVPAKEFISGIHTEVVSAYYSHPTIWSEIGYAGPAYPRGYVRSERGLTDPWEARQSNA